MTPSDLSLLSAAGKELYRLEQKASSGPWKVETSNKFGHYGPFDKEKGRRLSVCFDCMMKNESDAEKAFGEFLNGKEQ